MKKFLLRTGLFLLPLVAGMLMLVLGPFNKKRAYYYLSEDCEGRGAWIHRRLIESDLPLEIAFLGSSHTINSVDDTLIQAELERRHGGAHPVCNLGYCRLGRNLTWVFLRQLLSTKSPRMVVVEIMPDENAYGHPIFPFVAEGEDLLVPKSLVHRGYPEDMYNGVMARIRYIQQDIWQEPFVYNYGLIGDYGFAPVDLLADTAELQKKRMQLERNREKSHRWYRPLAMRFPKAYLKAMHELCSEKNVRMAFLYLPPYGTPEPVPLEYDFYRQFGEVWLPPDSIFANTANWYDPDHLNTGGAEELSRWVADQVTKVYNE